MLHKKDGSPSLRRFFYIAPLTRWPALTANDSVFHGVVTLGPPGESQRRLPGPFSRLGRQRVVPALPARVGEQAENGPWVICSMRSYVSSGFTECSRRGAMISCRTDRDSGAPCYPRRQNRPDPERDGATLDLVTKTFKSLERLVVQVMNEGAREGIRWHVNE